MPRETNTNKIKTDILCLKLECKDQAEFAKRAVTVIDKLTSIQSDSAKGEWLYRGELDKKLGEETAA